MSDTLKTSLDTGALDKQAEKTVGETFPLLKKKTTNKLAPTGDILIDMKISWLNPEQYKKLYDLEKKAEAIKAGVREDINSFTDLLETLSDAKNQNHVEYLG